MVGMAIRAGTRVPEVLCQTREERTKAWWTLREAARDLCWEQEMWDLCQGLVERIRELGIRAR